MAQIIRQSTAIDVAVGPFLDATDGNTVMSGLTITQPDIRLSKNGAAFAQKSAAQTASHMENGYYSVNLSTTDTNTVGRLTLHAHEATALPVFMEFQVIEEAIYDALFAASATGALPVSSGGIVAASFGAGAIDAAAIATGAIDADAIAANAIGSSEIADGAITAAKIATDAIDADALADGAITAATFAAGAIDASAIAADAIGSSELAATAVTEIQSGLATAAALQTVDDNVDAILVATETTIPAQITSEIDDVQADIAGLNDITVADIVSALKGQDRRNTADSAGSGANTLELAAADSATDDFYNGAIVILLEGAGADGVSASLRTRRITDYANSTNEITVDANWEEAPDNTTVYLILGG